MDIDADKDAEKDADIDVDMLSSDPIDSLLSLADLSVKDNALNIKEKACNTLCEVCKIYTNEKISCICQSNCIFFCHDNCFIKWIIDRRKYPFCMKCMSPYNIDVINRIFFHAQRLNQLYRYS